VPLTYRIDPERRLVVTQGRGILKDHEVFGYQQEVWSRSDVAGFDELVDMTAVTQILLPSLDRVRDLAELAAEMGRGAPRSKMAIVAPDDLAFGLGRMFEAFRESAAPASNLSASSARCPKRSSGLGSKAAPSNRRRAMKCASDSALKPAQSALHLTNTRSPGVLEPPLRH
jgi:hypothetical protein